MKLKDVIKTILITIFLTALCLLCYAKHNDFSSATEVYEVFIDGKEIGYLLDDNKLYELINNKQLEIKEKYKVSKVYPPENFKIIMILLFQHLNKYIAKWQIWVHLQLKVIQLLLREKRIKL